MDTRTFRHELEWYDYFYVSGKVCICPKATDVCTLIFFSREKLELLIQKHRFNLFLLPIYQHALEIIVKGENEHET